MDIIDSLLPHGMGDGDIPLYRKRHGQPYGSVGWKMDPGEKEKLLKGPSRFRLFGCQLDHDVVFNFNKKLADAFKSLCVQLFFFKWTGNLTGGICEPETVRPGVGVDGTQHRVLFNVRVVTKGEPKDANQIDQIGNGKSRQVGVGWRPHSPPRKNHFRGDESRF